MDDDKLSENERELKRLEEEELKKTEEETLAKRRIIVDIVERDPEDLHPHKVNIVLYGPETVDDTLVESILKKGQLEPIVITEDNTIISGHRRWLALKEINKIGRKTQVLDEGSVMHYHEDVFIKMKARCVVVNLLREEERILAIIDYNKRRDKRPSQYYNEIKMLHDIYDAEAERNMRKNLRQYADSTDLKSRHKKEKNSTLNDNEYYGKLYDEGGITDLEILKSSKYQIARKKDKKSTLDKIADEIVKGRTNVNKLTSIGDLAREEHDEVAIAIMKQLDNFKWSYNNAYNVYKLRDFQLKLKENSGLYTELDQKIKEVLEVDTEPYKDVKKKIISDETVKYYQDLVHEIGPKDKEKKEEKTKDKFSVILIEPENNFKRFNVNRLKADTSSSLFIIATHDNLEDCMTLMTKLNYTYRTFYFYIDQLLLLGTKSKLSPEVMMDKIENRDELYARIQKYYPKENYHEVKNSNTPKNEPDGWEISVGKSMSIDQAKAAKNANSKKKPSNITGTSDWSKNNNEHVGAGQT